MRPTACSPRVFMGGRKWELLTDISDSTSDRGLIPEVVLNHQSGRKVVLRNIPRFTWRLLETRLCLSNLLSVDRELEEMGFACLADVDRGKWSVNGKKR